MLYDKLRTEMSTDLRLSLKVLPTHRPCDGPDLQPFCSQANSLPGANRPIGPWPIRCMELLLPETFVSWSKLAHPPAASHPCSTRVDLTLPPPHQTTGHHPSAASPTRLAVGTSSDRWVDGTFSDTADLRDSAKMWNGKIKSDQRYQWKFHRPTARSVWQQCKYTRTQKIISQWLKIDL